MLAVARPPPQSAQLIALTEGAALMPSEPVRHVPAFLNSHHAGSAGLAVARSITTSSPVVVARSAPSSKLAMSTFVPVLLAHAKVLAATPASPKHSFQRRLTPAAADATVAEPARSRMHSVVVSFFMSGSSRRERERGRRRPRRGD